MWGSEWFCSWEGLWGWKAWLSSKVVPWYSEREGYWSIARNSQCTGLRWTCMDPDMMPELQVNVGELQSRLIGQVSHGILPHTFRKGTKNKGDEPHEYGRLPSMVLFAYIHSPQRRSKTTVWGWNWELNLLFATIVILGGMMQKKPKGSWELWELWEDCEYKVGRNADTVNIDQSEPGWSAHFSCMHMLKGKIYSSSLKWIVTLTEHTG